MAAGRAADGGMAAKFAADEKAGPKAGFFLGDDRRAVSAFNVAR